jgi:glycosyltransferase involved in cell wall biosynthesis
MSITVIVCTYNRCETLARTLDSIAASIVPNSVEWEVLIVDNNSTDKTREVVAQYSQRYPGRFRYLREGNQGLCFARNAGVRESRGDILAFTDDDATVEPDWLWNLTVPLRSGEWAGAGGRIVPVWERPLPRWLCLEKGGWRGPFVVFDPGPDAATLTEPPWGANMAFRRAMFEKYGGFRTDLGRRGSNLMGGEDVEFGRRLMAGGERLYYVPSAVVHHPIPASRMTKRYMLAWWFWFAVSEITEAGPPSDGGWLVRGVPLNYVCRLIRWSLQWLCAVSPSSRFAHRLTVWDLSGRLVGCYQWSRRKRSQVQPAMGISQTGVEAHPALPNPVRD